MRRLDALLKENSDLQTIAAHARDVTLLQKTWTEIVPQALRPFTQACGIKHRRITVFADNGAVASKLKLLSPILLKSLQIKGLEVTSIRVEVQVKSVAKAPARRIRKLSANAAESLSRLADTLPDSPLRQSILRLKSKV